MIAPNEIIDKNLPRNELLSRLSRLHTKSVAWVSGPPGAGKTNLVATYVKRQTSVIIWYEVEVGDEDPATFFHYLSENIKKKCGLAENWINPLKPEYLLSIDVYARQFFQLLCQNIDESFTLVFDQYQELPNKSIIHDLIKHFIRAIPSHSSIIFISRSDPPAALARFVINQEIECIGWNDLRFSENEIDALGHLWGFCHDEMQLLEEAKSQINGWVAGAVIICDFIRNVKKTPAIKDLSNSDILLNYFSGEILNKLSEIEKNFLFQISFLPRFSVAAAIELTGIDDALHIIEQLHSNHSFTEKLGYSSNEYQLHPLFRRFLRSRIKDELSKLDILNIKHRAASCLEKQGLVEHAITLWYETEQWDMLARIAESYTDTLIEQGRGSTVAKWFQQIPPAVVDKYPCFAYWRARAIMPYDTKEALRLYRFAYEKYVLLDTDVNKKWLCWAGCVATYIHDWKSFDDLDYWISELPFLPCSFPPACSIETKASVTSAMFIALLFRQPDHSHFILWEEASLALVKSELNINQKITTGNCLVLYYSWIADFPKCQVIMETMRENISQPDVLPLTRIIWHSMEAMYAWLGLKPQRCEEIVSKGLALANDYGIKIWDFMLNAQGAYGKLSSGQLAGATKYLKNMSRSVSGGRSLDASQYYYLSAWVAVLKKDYPQALEKIKFASDLTKDAGSPFPTTFVDIALSQVLFEQGEKSRARVIIKHVNSIADSLRSRHFKHHSLLVLAYFDLMDGSYEQGINYLEQGFRFARENHFLSLIWWRPELMSKLCGIALLHNIEAEYVKELIIKNELTPDEKYLGLEQWPWQVKITSFSHFTLFKNDILFGSSGKSQVKPLDLLKVLLAYGGKSVSVTKITDCLWPDADGDMGQHSFSTTLYRLRKLLGCENSLLLNNAQLSLNPIFCWTDVWAIEMLEKKIEQKLLEATFDPSTAACLEIELFNLYQGAFLSLESEKPWFFIKREKERNRFIRIAEHIGKYWLDNSQIDNAIRFYQKAIEIDYLVESFYQQLILAYQRAGRKAEANSVYKQCEQALSDFDDIRPSEKTKKIFRDCMSS